MERSTDHGIGLLRAAGSLFRALSLGGRFGQARHRSAIIVAGLYWCSVPGTYTWALIAKDESGLLFLPFTYLALPWSVLMRLVAEQIPNVILANIVYAFLCFLLSGVNALILYFLIVGSSVLIAKVVARRSGNSGTCDESCTRKIF